MKSLINQIKKMISELNRLLYQDDNRHYNVAMGILSSLIMSILEITTFILIDETLLINPYVYLLSGVLMVMQFIIFLDVYHRGFESSSKFIKVMTDLHPFFIVAIGVGITQQYQGFSNQTYSYLLAVLAASLIQIYKPKKRIAIFLFSFLSFNVIMLISHGFSVLFYENLRLSILVVIIGFIYTTVQYLSSVKRESLMNQLAMTNSTQQRAIEDLNMAYQNLDQSHQITEGMMKLTMTILEREDLDDVLQAILEEAIRIIPKAQAGSILIYNGEVMEFRAAYGYSLKNLQKVTLHKEDLFQAKLDDLYEPAIIQDLRVFDEAHLDDDKVQKLHEQGALVALSILTCSFKYNNEFFGSINIDNFESRDIFNESDKRLIKHLAKQIEITIAIHKLFGNAIGMTRYDVLTQANTRRYHLELMEKLYLHAKKSNSKFAVVSLDLNDLKQINDQFGHDAGDDALRYFASSIRRFMAKDTIFSRLGGDEFMMACPSKTAEQARELIREIKQFFVEHPFYYQHHSIKFSVAIGVAEFPTDGETLEEVIKQSDVRMYEDKAESKKQTIT